MSLAIIGRPSLFPSDNTALQDGACSRWSTALQQHGGAGSRRSWVTTAEIHDNGLSRASAGGSGQERSIGGVGESARLTKRRSEGTTDGTRGVADQGRGPEVYRGGSRVRETPTVHEPAQPA
ncbi:hypothetical protein M758_UG317500 [Ceratodon purpureus]|nr:hypothetical protein M758_UG317500 [Ceratodon purpureus]